jgi:uncharacterized UBP type Zn finger protein
MKETVALIVPCGLRNLGATCYVNSMVQCLFMNISFRRAVQEWEPKDPHRVDPKLLEQMHALQRLFSFMELSIQSYVDPQEFAGTLALNNLVQQDAHVPYNGILCIHDDDDCVVGWIYIYT